MRSTFTRGTLLLSCGALLLGGCRDDPTRPELPESPPESERMQPLGVVEVSITGIGTPSMTASVASLSGPSFSLSPPRNQQGSTDGSIQLELASNGSFSEGSREGDGQRYLWATFRVRNAQADGTPYDTPRQNLTFVAVSTETTIGDTPVSSLRRSGGSQADSSIAFMVVPTGAVIQDDSLAMTSQFPDVLQVFTEAEVESVNAPSGVKSVFPYGFVARNPGLPSSRTLPANPGPNQWDGLVTFAFRVPLQSTPAADPEGIKMTFLAFDDPTVRITESVEEQGPEARAAVAARASALSAEMVTVLVGSSSTGYPGQRRICGVRTAGLPGSERTTVTAPGAYTRLAIYREGESRDGCAANFRTGESEAVGVGLPTKVVVRAMDRYGNVKTGVADSVELRSAAEGFTGGERAALENGEQTFTVEFGAYGDPALIAEGRRRSGAREIPIKPITRTWTGQASSDWSDSKNWDVGAPPASRDRVVFPAEVSRQPTLTRPGEIGSLTLPEGVTLSLGEHDLTINGDIKTAWESGGIESTGGRVILAGEEAWMEGRLPRVVVTGKYSCKSRVVMTAPVEVNGGSLNNNGWLMEIRSN